MTVASHVRAFLVSLDRFARHRPWRCFLRVIPIHFCLSCVDLLCVGWFSIENFKLFNFTIFEYHPKCMFIILDIQIAKFSIEILIDLI